jgi:hypothetical protein
LNPQPSLVDLLCKECGKDWKGFFPHGREDGLAECPCCKKMGGDDDSIEKRYFQLIFQVGNKYEGESRHMTALRYLKNAEDGNSEPSKIEAKP